MTEQTSPQTSSVRQIDRVCSYVSDHWFPVNPALLAKIKNGLKDGRYQDNTALLVTELKGDFALFIYCLRELSQMILEEGGEKSVPSSPLDLCQWAGLDRIKGVISKSEKSFSRHSLEGITDLQRARLQEAIISATTSETLSEKYALDSGTAYAAALMRQLGHVLIAWNYPNVYREAVGSLKSGIDFDLTITHQLGFSPGLLALRLLKSWNIAPEYCSALEDKSEEDDEEEQIMSSIGDTLARICRVGEALARANSPETYPSAAQDWELAKLEIETHLGKSGMNLIKEKFSENCENYINFIPHIFEAGVILDPEFQAPHKDSSDAAESSNPFLVLCEPELRQGITALYEKLKPNMVTRENVRILARQIIPLSRFSGGYIYTIDPTIMMLVPQMKVGTPHLRAMQPVDYSVVLADGDAVTVAFQSDELVVEYRQTRAGEVLAAVAGLFGASQRMGVLYLEMPHATFSAAQQKHMNHFKALTQTLNDCLNLK